MLCTLPSKDKSLCGDTALLRGRAWRGILALYLLLCGAAAAQAPAATPAPATAADGTIAGTIAGTVTDPRGALVGGAHVQLSGAGGASSSIPVRQTTTGSDGRFRFDHATPGEFKLAVTLAGFDAASATGSLQPGQSLEVPPIALKLATATFAVEVYADPHQLAAHELHMQEQQRLIGIFPNFFVSYDWAAPPLSTKQKFTLAWRNASDPGNLLLVGTTAGFQQADNAFSGYGQGAAGYGRRYGADLGNLVAGTFMGGAVLPSLFHQDPRYFYQGTGSTRSRILHALSSAVICRGDNGHRQPAFASVLGDLSAGAISNLYYPASDRQGAALTLENGFLGVAGDTLNGLFQEFFLRKLTPGLKKATAPSP